jgi:hypothetical protein
MKTQSTRHHLNWLQHGSTQEAALKASALHWTTAIKIVPAAPTTSQDLTQLLLQPLPRTSHLPCVSEDRVKPHSGATSSSERPATVAAVPTINRQQPPARLLCQPLQWIQLPSGCLPDLQSPTHHTWHHLPSPDTVGCRTTGHSLPQYDFTIHSTVAMANQLPPYHFTVLLLQLLQTMSSIRHTGHRLTKQVPAPWPYQASTTKYPSTRSCNPEPYKPAAKYLDQRDINNYQVPAFQPTVPDSYSHRYLAAGQRYILLTGQQHRRNLGQHCCAFQ